jgi:hypothetical protein
MGLGASGFAISIEPWSTGARRSIQRARPRRRSFGSTGGISTCHPRYTGWFGWMVISIPRPVTPS